MNAAEEPQSIETLCTLFGKTRQAFYKKGNQVYQQEVNNDLIITLVKNIRDHQKRTGGRKLHYMVFQDLPPEQQMGRDKFFHLLRENNLLVKGKKYRVYTTDSSHWLHKYANLILELKVDRPNQLWVSDITYIHIKNKFVYLFLITDAYSRKIIGWCLSDNIDASNAVKALQMALDQRMNKDQKLIHHSDRGVQYCSLKYVNCLNKNGIKISMSNNSDPYENAIAERVNGILKTEWLYDMELNSIEEAKKAVKSIINIYNNERPHSSIEMLTPSQAHQMSGELKRLWKNYKKNRAEEMISPV